MDPTQHILEAFEKAEHGAFGVLSTSETLAVALVLNRHDLLGHYTMLEAVERLGPEWTRAARVVAQSLPIDRIQRARKAA